MNKKLFGKLNWGDLIIIVAVLAAAVIVGYKMFLKPTAAENTDTSTKMELTFFVEESPEYAANLVKEGDRVYDETMNCVLGTVTSVEIGESHTYAANSEGQMVRSGKPGYNSVKITSEVNATPYENGVMVGVTKYGVGHTFTFYAGQAKLYGKLAGINGGK